MRINKKGAQLLERAGATWRDSLFIRLVFGIAGFFVVLGLVGLAVNWSWPLKEDIWSVSNLDRAVLYGLIALTLLALGTGLAKLIWPDSERLAHFKSDAIQIAGGAMVILSLYVAYASFRNQGRLTSEIALNDEGRDLQTLEMDHPEIRCLYLHYGHDTSAQCLERIASDADQWSLSIFYVEEAWFLLEKAREDRTQWGSTYATAIEYWALDMSLDPTGLFSYYLISTEDSLASARSTMAGAGVSIADPCGNFRAVWSALARHAAEPRYISGAARECGARLTRPVAAPSPR